MPLYRGTRYALLRAPVVAVEDPGEELGPEKIASQNLNTGWSSGGAFGNLPGSTANATTITTTGDAGARYHRFGGVTQGETYRFTCDATYVSGDGAQIMICFGDSDQNLIFPPIQYSDDNITVGSGPLVAQLEAPAGAAYCECVVIANGPSGSQATFENLSCRQVL